MSYKREIPRLNKNNFSAWQGLMKLHLAAVGDTGLKYLDEKYEEPSGTLSVNDIAEKKTHNNMIIDIASALSYEEFDDIKDCKTAFDMWNKLKEIYGGDDNVKRAKAESLRGQFDQMKMREDENIAKYVDRIKACVSAIRASRGDIKEETVISKVLRTLLPIYAIRVSAIQERRCEANHKINLEAIVGRLTAFELDNFDNYVPASKNTESAFEAKLSLKEKGKRKSESESNDESDQSSDSDLEVIEALLAKKYSRGRGKYKGKVPLICFSCEEIGHIAARCPNKQNNDEKKGHKWNGKKDYKSFKNKGKKSCFIAKDSKDSDNSEDEIVYIAVKDESDNDNEEDDEMALISHVRKNDTWIIDSGCSHHMNRDKNKFITLNYYDGNC